MFTETAKVMQDLFFMFRHCSMIQFVDFSSFIQKRKTNYVSCELRLMFFYFPLFLAVSYRMACKMYFAHISEPRDG
jgi:hypothetical protein